MTTTTTSKPGAQGGSGLRSSNRRNPCPICGRTKDGDCRISADLVLCHRGATHHPPTDLEVGRSIVNGWAYTGESKDGRAATFTPHKELDRHPPRLDDRIYLRAELNQQQAPPAAVPQVPRFADLARLPHPVTEPPDHWPHGYRLTYSPSQSVVMVVRPSGKQHIPHHASPDRGEVKGKGLEPWPLWCEAAALEHGSGRWIAEAEGEKCAAWLQAGGLVAVSQPGHDHTLASIKARYSRLQAAGVAGVLYLADNDQTGQDKGERCATAAAAVGLPLLVISAAAVWPDLPAGGSIDDAPGTAADRVEALAPALARVTLAAPQQQGQDGPTLQRHEKRHTLAPDEVLQTLPLRMGRLRLNVRTGDVHTSDGVLSGNQIGRLYLELSNPAERWPKDATTDAVMLLAHRDQFDPVKDWLEGLEAEPLPMEQWQRLDQHLLGIDDPIAATFLPRFLISAVARTMEPGCGYRQSPVLVGPQWRGKTALGRILFGADQWLQGVGALDRDALQRMRRSWGIELAELDGVTRRADQEALKDFLTAQVDTYRAPYDRSPEDHPRRFVFWGTANRPPLRDATGSTRFVCISIPDRMLPLEWAQENRAAIWARALEQYRAGVKWEEVGEEERRQIEERNADFVQEHPWTERVRRFLAMQLAGDQLPVTVPQVLDHLCVPVGQHNASNAKTVEEIAQSLGWVRGRRRWQGRPKAQGLWPADVPGHPGHPSGHPPGTPPDPFQQKGSDTAGHPGHPFSQTVSGEEEGQGRATAADGDARQGVGQKGCPGCPPPETPVPDSGLPGHRGVPGGVPGGCPPPADYLPAIQSGRIACWVDGEGGWTRAPGPMRGLSVLVTHADGRQLAAGRTQISDHPPAPQVGEFEHEFDDPEAA